MHKESESTHNGGAPDPKERRRQARRQAAARATWERFATQGYADARLDALAEDAGLSKQALLFYFRDKADLWAEAVGLATEEVSRALARMVIGETGPTAIRALRRGIDDVARALPAPFAILLDASSTATRASVEQQEQAAGALATLLSILAKALAHPKRPGEPAHRLARLAWLSLLAHHREARLYERAGLTPKSQLAADLDFTERHLVSLTQR